jgi:hypothetical protein
MIHAREKSENGTLPHHESLPNYLLGPQLCSNDDYN